MLHPEAERTLRAMVEPGENTNPIIDRVAAKGLADELHDRDYLVLDGIDVTLKSTSPLNARPGQLGPPGWTSN